MILDQWCLVEPINALHFSRLNYPLHHYFTLTPSEDVWFATSCYELDFAEVNSAVNLPENCLSFVEFASAWVETKFFSFLDAR
jgi:hypothetical protein